MDSLQLQLPRRLFQMDVSFSLLHQLTSFSLPFVFCILVINSHLLKSHFLLFILLWVYVIFIPCLSFCVLSGSSGFKRTWSQTGHQGQSLTYTAKQMDYMRLCVREFSNEGAKMRRKPDSLYLSLKSNFICLEKTSNNSDKPKQVVNGMKPNRKPLLFN